MDIELVGALEMVRMHFCRPVVISSGCRCAAHNAKVGGKPSSQHVFGKAADFSVVGVSSKEVQAFLISMCHGKYGIGVYEHFTHLDVRRECARW